MKHDAKNLNLTYDNDLPIVQRREEIADIIRHNQVAVVCGETGSGKSTQLPKICLEIGRHVVGMIGHTQPRRIAARSIAARIAEELGVVLGQEVGYEVRFDKKVIDSRRQWETADGRQQTAAERWTPSSGDTVADSLLPSAVCCLPSPASLIKLMTDGILLAESQSDKYFRKYGTIIIDEAHERSLNIDFLLGMMKRVLPHRPELKLIITSATIDARRFAEHFTDRRINRGVPVPVVEVSGRMFPVEIRYRSLEDLTAKDAKVGAKNAKYDGVSRETDAEEEAILSAIYELYEHGNGDILIFLPTERDILETANDLRREFKNRNIEILPLYARLPVHQQQRVFNVSSQTSSHRRIILATNVAESSLTVPGIRYVIDTGTARMSRYSARSRTQRLPIEAVSQASADQRAGRCGRIGPGVCIRLYPEDSSASAGHGVPYKHRERYTTPEIQRTNLASVILQTKSLKLGEIEFFPFIDPPRTAAITDGYKTLYEIGAIDDRRNLTSIGWKLSKLPVDPRIGRMILAAHENGVLPEMLIVASVMEIQDPRERPQEFQGKADAAHEIFLDKRSDFFGYIKLWDFYQNLKAKTSRSGLRKACQQHFLSFNRMREWEDIHAELQRIVREAKMLTE